MYSRHFLAIILIFLSFCLITCSRKKDNLRTYAMGEKVEVGRLVYTVYETQWLTQLGQGVDAKIPQHRFFVVRISAGNSGNGDQMVPSMTIQDDNGNTYPELTNGEGVPQWIGVLRQVRPAEAAQGNIAFDAPPRHYKLRVTDEDEQQAALIDIPLSFVSEAPEIALPTTEKK